jgi:hypothetical protein
MNVALTQNNSRLRPEIEIETKLMSVMFLMEVSNTWAEKEMPEEAARSRYSHNSEQVAQQYNSDGGEPITGSLDINNSDDPPHGLSGIEPVSSNPRSRKQVVQGRTLKRKIRI